MRTIILCLFFFFDKWQFATDISNGRSSYKTALTHKTHFTIGSVKIESRNEEAFIAIAHRKNNQCITHTEFYSHFYFAISWSTRFQNIPTAFFHDRRRKEEQKAYTLNSGKEANRIENKTKTYFLFAELEGAIKMILRQQTKKKRQQQNCGKRTGRNIKCFIVCCDLLERYVLQLNQNEEKLRFNDARRALFLFSSRRWSDWSKSTPSDFQLQTAKCIAQLPAKWTIVPAHKPHNHFSVMRDPFKCSLLSTVVFYIYSTEMHYRLKQDIRGKFFFLSFLTFLMLLFFMNDTNSEEILV